MKEDDIDRYLRKELSDQERTTFEAQMERDLRLRDRVNEMQASIELIRAHGKDELRAAFAEMDAEEADSATVVPVSNARQGTWFIIAKWAAAAAAILLAGFWFLSKSTAEPPQLVGLFEEYFNPFPNISDPLVRDDQGNNNKLMRLYDQQDYVTFIQSAEKIANPSDTTLAYLVSARLATGQINKAEVALNRLSKVQNLRFRQTADWYKLMLALKRNDAEAARDQASLIVADERHLYRDRTLVIVAALD